MNARAIEAAPPAAVAPRRRLRATLAWLHLWLGLSVGLVFAVVGLSGSALVFHEDLLRWQYPVLAEGRAVADPVVLERIVAQGRDSGLRAVQLPAPTMPTWIGFHADGRRVHYASDDGRVLLERHTGNDPLLWLHELHTHLLAGERGEALLGVAGLVSVAMLLIGLVLWWPQRGRMLAQLKVHAGPPIRRWLTWHRTSGVLLLPLLLLSTLTGLGMVYDAAARRLLTSAFGGGEPPPPPDAPPAPAHWARVLQAAQRGAGDAVLTRVNLPAADAGTVGFRARQPAEWHPNGRSTVTVDTRGTAVLQVHHAAAQPAGTRASYAIYPLHIGVAGGLPLRVATFVAGLLPAFLLVTGALFWLRRRAARRHRPNR